MSRPRLFLSAVSQELRSARQDMAATVRTLGFDPVSQDDFPTGHGELKAWLREQLDASEGLIQLIGQGYGAEPPEPDPEFGRVSYTQYELLYARQQGKKIWTIVIGEDFPRDIPVERLDLLQDGVGIDCAAYQAERRALQHGYLARLSRENQLRHTAADRTHLENIILRLRDELGGLRSREERKRRGLLVLIAAIFATLIALSGGGYFAYHKLNAGVEQTGKVNTLKIRAHLLSTVEATHRRELAEAEAAKDWKERQNLREAVAVRHAARMARIEELAASFAEIEGRGAATAVFSEMTRILAEQGADEAIAYVAAQQSSILKTVQTRATAAHNRNRVDLQPLLQTASLYETKGQNTEAQALYMKILVIEPDWPEALHASFSFHISQGDWLCSHATQTQARGEYELAEQTAQHLVTMNPTNAEWQKDLAVSFDRFGSIDMVHGRLDEAKVMYHRQSRWLEL